MRMRAAPGSGATAFGGGSAGPPLAGGPAGGLLACGRALAHVCVVPPLLLPLSLMLPLNLLLLTLSRTALHLTGVRRRGGSAPGSGRGMRVGCRGRQRGGWFRCRLAQVYFSSRQIWSGFGCRTGLGRRAVAGSLWLVRRADAVGLLDEERVRLLSLGGVAVRVDQGGGLARGEGSRDGRLTHRWVGQTGRHGNDEHRGQPSRNPHCVGTGAHSLAVVEGSGSAHRLAYSLAHAPRCQTRVYRPLLRSYS